MALDKDLKQEIATIDKDVTMPFFGGVLRPNDDTLLTRGGGKGLKIYDDIERDCHARAVLQKRKMAVIAREWTVEAASTSKLDQKAADLVREQLNNLSGDAPDDEVLPQATGFDAVCLNLLDATLKGFSVGEIMWATDGAEIVAAEVRPKAQQRFVFTKGTSGYKLSLKTFQNMYEGEPVPPRKFISHHYGAKDGNPYGLGLGHSLFWPVFFKRQDITFWLTFVDKFASPTAVGKYPKGTGIEDQKKLLDALQAISRDAGVIVPEGMLMELLEAKRSGIDTYETLARYMDEQISEAVLGETLSTNLGGSGSLAAAKTHNEVRLELVKADSDLLCGTLNHTLVKWLALFNVPGATPPRVWREIAEPEDLKTRAERDGILAEKSGVRLTKSYFVREYGFQEDDIEAIAPVNQGAASSAPTKPGDASFAEGEFTPDQQALEDLADAVVPHAADSLSGNEAKILAAVQSANSYEEAMLNVLELYPGMDMDGLARFLERACLNTSIFGRYAVQQEEK